MWAATRVRSRGKRPGDTCHATPALRASTPSGAELTKPDILSDHWIPASWQGLGGAEALASAGRLLERFAIGTQLHDRHVHLLAHNVLSCNSGCTEGYTECPSYKRTVQRDPA